MRNVRSQQSLIGLSVGDAFGDRFFVSTDVAERWISERDLPAAPWLYTDDTNMALSVVAILEKYQTINQDALAASFAERYDPSRGYGPAMHRMLNAIKAGESWQAVARNQFAGQGSYGNGAAMRVAPLGAYFADDLDAVVEQAERSAVITHAHPEAVAGAIAVAVAAAQAWHNRATQPQLDRAAFLELVLPFVADSEVRTGIRRARDLSKHTTVSLAAAMLGNGTGLSAQDTVPFALWCAGESLYDFVEAMWLTVAGLGDRDTTCAIAGGIVALAAGPASIPAEWLSAREPLPSPPDLLATSSLPLE